MTSQRYRLGGVLVSDRWPAYCDLRLSLVRVSLLPFVSFVLHLMLLFNDLNQSVFCKITLIAQNIKYIIKEK